MLLLLKSRHFKNTAAEYKKAINAAKFGTRTVVGRKTLPQIDPSVPAESFEQTFFFVIIGSLEGLAQLTDVIGYSISISSFKDSPSANTLREYGVATTEDSINEIFAVGYIDDDFT